MSGTAIQRLDYFNGQRLEAADLRLEQSYHLDMRRRLNRELFTPGVVSGGEVLALEDDKTHVRLLETLVLDPVGRELVIDQQKVPVPTQPPPPGLGGFFLVARYGERRLPADEDPCRAPGSAQYARVSEEPKVQWTDTLPMRVRCKEDPGSIECAVVLAFVRMVACEVDKIELGVRELSRPRHTSQASVMALEGEKDIDKDNPKVLHFVPRGGEPSSVVLYLWGAEFSSLYYTQMGEHSHTLSAGTLALSPMPDHKHALGDHTHKPTNVNANGKLETNDFSLQHSHALLTSPFGEERHVAFKGNKPWPQVAVATEYYEHLETRYNRATAYVSATGGVGRRPWVGPAVLPSADNEGEGTPIDDTHLELSLTLGNRVKADGTPAAAETGGVTAAGGPTPAPALTQDATVTKTGSPQHPAGSAAAYGFLADLEVWLDGKNITTQFVAALPASWGNRLGDGSKGHALNQPAGTGPIDLIDVARAAGLAIEDVPHWLEFKVAAGGGQLLYNLYVE